MPLQQIERSRAERAIIDGPLAIGEEHTKTEGRQLVRHLMNRNLVKVLILEVPKDTKRPCSKALTDAVMTKQANLGDDAVAAAIRPIDGFMWQNSVSLSTLIREALAKNIRVVFADKHYIRANAASKPRAMAVRNAQVDRVFMEASPLGGANRSGCLILFGAAHFRMEDQGQTFANTIGASLRDRETDEPITLPWIDMTTPGP